MLIPKTSTILFYPKLFDKVPINAFTTERLIKYINRICITKCDLFSKIKYHINKVVINLNKLNYRHKLRELQKKLDSRVARDNTTLQDNSTFVVPHFEHSSFGNVESECLPFFHYLFCCNFDSSFSHL